MTSRPDRRGTRTLVLASAVATVLSLAVLALLRGDDEPPGPRDRDGPARGTRAVQLPAGAPDDAGARAEHASVHVPPAAPAVGGPEPLATLAGEPFGRPVTWRGRAVDEAGAPVAGARVWVVPNGAGLFARGVLPEPHSVTTSMGVAEIVGRLDVPLGVLPHATTDASGLFALHDHHAEDPSSEDELTFGRPYATVVVAAPGHIVRAVRAPPVQDGVSDLGDLCLSPEMLMTGRVLDDDGSPVSDAEVALWTALAYDVGCGLGGTDVLTAILPELSSARSGADGRFALGGLPPGDLSFRVSAPGYVAADFIEAPALPASTGWSSPAPDVAPMPPPGGSFDAGDVVLARGLALRGRVVDREGRPVPGLTVFATTRPRDGIAHGCEVTSFAEGDDTLPLEILAAQGPLSPATRTGHDGRFVLPDVPDERLAVYAYGFGWEPAGVRNVRPGREDVELVVAPEATLRLRLVAAESGAAVEGAAVFAWRITGVEGSDAPLPVSRLPPGEVLVHGVGPLGTRVSVLAPGRAGSSATIPPGAGTRASTTLRLPAGFVARGRVVDGAGRPLQGVAVEALAHGALLTRPGDVTDRDGRFELRDLPDVRLPFEAAHPEFGAETFDVVPGGSGETEVVLHRLGRLTGRVTDADGRALAGRVVELEGPLRADGERGVRTLQTDADGVFEQADLRPGPYHLSAIGGDSAQVDLSEGGHGRVDLRAAPDARVRGRVLRGGLPVVGATVELQFSDARAISDADGRFELVVSAPCYGYLRVQDPAAGAPALDTDALTLTWGDVVERDVHLP